MDMTISWTHIITVTLFVIGGWVAVRNSMQTRLNAIDVKLAAPWLLLFPDDDPAESYRYRNL